MEALIQAMEAFWKIRFPEALRARYLDNDPAALKAAWTKALAEGAVARDLRIWGVRCLIFYGSRRYRLLEQAQRASTEIPNAEFLSLAGRDHIAAHMGQGDPVIEAVLRMLRAEVYPAAASPTLTADKFDPATHPGPLRVKLAGNELEIVRGYAAEEIRARLGAELLARASAGLLEPAEELPNTFEKKSTAVMRRHQNEGVLDVTFDLVSAAEAMCSPSLPGVPYPHRARGDTS